MHVQPHADISIVPNAKVGPVDFHTNAPLAAQTIPHSNAAILYCHFNPLPDIAPSPENIERLMHELIANPLTQKIALLSAFENGFDIGWKGPHFSMLTENLKSAAQCPEALCQNIFIIIIIINNLFKVSKKVIALSYLKPTIEKYNL